MKRLFFRKAGGFTFFEVLAVVLVLGVVSLTPSGDLEGLTTVETGDGVTATAWGVSMFPARLCPSYLG